jgi:hypothetical protein
MILDESACEEGSETSNVVLLVTDVAVVSLGALVLICKHKQGSLEMFFFERACHLEMHFCPFWVGVALEMGMCGTLFRFAEQYHNDSGLQCCGEVKG